MASKARSRTVCVLLAAGLFAPFLCFLNYCYFLPTVAHPTTEEVVIVSPEKILVRDSGEEFFLQAGDLQERALATGSSKKETGDGQAGEVVQNEPFGDASFGDVWNSSLLHPKLPHLMLQQPTSVCSEDVFPFAVLGVASRAHQRQRRMFLRTMIYSLAKSHARIVFVMAMHKEEMADQETWDEIEAFQDLLIFDNAETYYGLSNKTQVLITWFHQFCAPHVRYLIKVDDDVAINWGPLQNLLSSLPKTDEPQYVGRTFRNGLVITKKTHRNREVSPQLLNNITRYPKYNSGPIYVLNPPAAATFVDTLATDYQDWAFRNEDAMVGIVLNKTGVLPIRNSSFLPKYPDAKGKCIHVQDFEDTRPVCPCDSWVALHCGSKGKVKCMKAWRRVVECNLDEKSASDLTTYIHPDVYG